MLMRLPLLTHVQKSRGQHQGISPNPQGQTSSSPASIVAEYCLVIATFILLLILPKSRGRRGQQTTVAGEGGEAKTWLRGWECVSFLLHVWLGLFSVPRAAASVKAAPPPTP